jgi:HlyD family secretion protein
VSALGIEEQRVNVIIDLVSDRSEWSRLGHGYQVDVRIVLWEADDVLTLPLTALFRENGDWSVFVVSDGVAERRPVEVGQRNGLAAEIVAGLEAGETIVLHPGDNLSDGVRVKARG